MKTSRLISSITVTVTLLTLLAGPNVAAPQKLTSLLATANGKGTLIVGSEEFKVTTVVVKLKDDGVAEITLVTELQLFVSGRWSSPADLSAGVNLKITSGGARSVHGTGKLFLKPDEKSIVSLSLQGSNDTQRKKMQLNFVAD